jgi:SAM-dependent methyltransferase
MIEAVMHEILPSEAPAMNSTKALEDYAREAPDLVESFEALAAADVYAPLADLLPAQPARFVDIGAGTGRDAAWFASLGHRVLAVEPTDGLRAAGMKLHPSERIVWLSDTLPELERTLARDETFDRAIVCAVWQHLSRDERVRAIPSLARLLAPDGLLIMVLRHEPPGSRRANDDSQRHDAESLACDSGLSLAFACEGPPVSPANRASGVTLTWLAFAQAKRRA